MPLPTAKAIEIAVFVDSSEIDPVRLFTSYYLAADGAVARKPYTLLCEALKRSSKVAIAKFALRGRERLGLLSIRDDALAGRDPRPFTRNPADVVADQTVSRSTAAKAPRPSPPSARPAAGVQAVDGPR
ncbi:Ku protein [Streptomyces sp. NPDC102274]|uniref:Ku protein n=1 Tax=Streptomyces sp. NPDC102274 TaxID=3366151 RepID=UPI00381026CE